MNIVDGQRNGLIVGVDARSRALSIWPGLDRSKLTRTCGDPYRIARLVERRTALPRESILRLLGVRPIEDLALVDARRTIPAADLEQGARILGH